MKCENSKLLPKDKHLRPFEPSWEIHNVSQYINRVNEYIQAKKQEDCIFVYRGEPDIYPTPCRPNIFRKNVMNGNVFFEKNLFEAMRQNKLTGEARYLDNAIDAQHGEFPSRLLDVTYNCLTALYFAVTPYYHREETALDDKDGMVFLFFIHELYSPSAKNINDNYDAILNRDLEWYHGKVLFEKNHKFIDHTKLNNRITAQQGAFILFPGDEAEDLPECSHYGIRIPGSSKPLIREQLRLLFGIHTGSIYPEINNLVEELSNKSKRLHTESFCCTGELRLALSRLERELEYYLDYAMEQKHSGLANMEQILMHIEHVVDSYRKGLLEFTRAFSQHQERWEKNYIGKTELADIIQSYNRSVQDFSDEIFSQQLGEFSGDALQIQIHTTDHRKEFTNEKADGKTESLYQPDSGKPGNGL